jgi:hypothetical protein
MNEILEKIMKMALGLNVINGEIQSLTSRETIESPYDPDYERIEFLFNEHKSGVKMILSLIIGVNNE